MNTRLGILMSLLFVACTGTDTGNPPVALDGFFTGGCKNSLFSASGELIQKGTGATLMLDAVRGGLQCFVWKRLDDETLSIEITNHQDGCGADMGWTPRAVLNDQGELDLFLDNNQCIFAACGNCIYDLAFRVKVPVDTKQLRTRLYGDDCNGERALANDGTLPLGEQPSGVLCVDYRPRAFTEMYGCGQSVPPFAYCAKQDGAMACDTSSPPACVEGTECTLLGDNDLKCLPMCESDADCSPYPSTQCEKHVCRL